jgi:hypothetical protein
MRGLEDFRFGIDSTDKSGSLYHQEIRLSILGLAGSLAVRAVVGSQEADGSAIPGAVDATVSFCRSNNSV